METLSTVDFNWRAIQRTLNTVIRGVNARTPIAGDMILIDGAISNGVVISADKSAIAAMIADAVATAKESANAKAASAAETATGGGTAGGADQSGSGEGAGWDFLGPISDSPTSDGNPVNIYPNQQDLSNDIISFTINRNYMYGGNALTQGQVTVYADGTHSGSFFQILNPDGTPYYPPGGFWYTIIYHYADSSQPGSVSPAFTVPPQGGSIVLGDQSILIPSS